MSAEYAQPRVLIPRHGKRTTGYLLCLFITCYTIWGIVHHYPSPDPQLGVCAVVFGWGMAALARFRGPSEVNGTLVTYRAILWARHCDLEEARGIEVKRYWNGSACLTIQPPRGTRIYLPIVTVNDIRHGFLPPDSIDHLIDILNGLKNPHLEADTTTKLAQQAQHLRNGGTLADSPLLAR